MGEKNVQGEEESKARILVLIPAEREDLIDEVSEMGGVFREAKSLLKKYECIKPRIDFYRVEKPTGKEPIRLFRIDDNQELLLKKIEENGYCLGIAFGDRLARFIIGNRHLTPEPPNGSNAPFPFLLIATASISVISEPHLRAYPNEETVGMLLARLMTEAKKRAEAKGIQCNQWCALFYDDEKSEEGMANPAANTTINVVGCRKSFEDHLEGFDLKDSKDFTQNHISEFSGNLDEAFWEDHKNDRLFCVYAASALDHEAYDNVVRKINEFGREYNENKILVTDACWDVPEGCEKLWVAQLGLDEPYQHGDGSEKRVGKELYTLLIRMLLELSLKTLKWNPELMNSRSSAEIAKCFMSNGPLMVTKGKTFSFIEREMFIPFSYHFWPEKVGCNFGAPEETRSIEEAREAIALAMSRIETAADGFKRKRTGATPESLKTATSEFAGELEEKVLKPCFAAREVFFVDDKHEGVHFLVDKNKVSEDKNKVSKKRPQLAVTMPEKIVREVADESRVIQVAYNRRNIENTEAVQLYRVCKGVGSEVVVPVTDSLLSLLECLRGIDDGDLMTFQLDMDKEKKKTFFEEKKVSLESEKIFCSRSQQRAVDKFGKPDNEWAWDCDNDGILVGLVTANRVMPSPNKSDRRYRYNYFYYIPTYNWDGSGSTPAVAFFSDVKFCDFELSALKMVVTRFYSALYTEDRVRKAKNSAIRAAIGAIMSRNGSHNIGSHVLASLSHNVGTMPDDRVLYQYIQHRMDYIATATTEAPRWTQPTMFVASMMKEFLRQKHLLDHISGSEGLHAYKFQGHSAGGEQENTIRVHVRRIKPMKGTKWENLGFFDKGQASVTEFIRYPNEQDDEARVDISQDVAVAIPGGVIGQHAFYTILENVLRNAAKHEWSQFEIACRRHLNLYVDFVDQPEKGSVVCRVWTECVLTEVDGGTRHQGANDDLLKHMNEKIALSFVNASGELRKENWGIAEMRISAGYLRGCDIADVGGTGSLQIIHPVLVDTNDKRKGLGYCFKINKPKELLVVLKEETVREIDETSASGGVRNVFGINLAKANADALPCGKDEAARKIDETPTLGGVRNDFGTNLDKANAKALQYGVEFKAASKVKNAEANAYSYMLFEDSDHDQIAELLACVPFRTLTQKNGYGGEFFTAGDLVERFRKIGESEEYARATCLQLLEDVYAGWLKHISGVRYGEKAKKLQLAIDIEGEASSPGGRQSLVSDCDLIRFVFEHSFNAAIRSFLSDAKNGAGISNECMALLYAVAGMRQRQVASFKELVANGRNKSGGSVTEDEVNTELKTEHGVAQVVLWQLEKWFVEILKGSGELNLKKMLSEDDLKRHESLKDKEVLKIGTLEEFYGRAGNYVTVERFTMFIESTILKQAESFLRKYEEDISTMPQGFSPKPDRGTEPTSCKWEKAGVSIGFVNDDIKRAKCKRDGAFCYFRHGEQTFKMYTTGYYEALSGAQSGLNALDSYRRDVKYVDDATSSSSADDLDVKLAKNNAARFTARLAENAIVRLLIIDERVKKFMDDHDNVKRMLPGLGIAVLDHTSQTTKEMFPKGEDAKWGAISGVKIDDIEKTGDKKPLPMTLSDFEVVIIHQGVIDKLLDGHDSKEAVRKWLAEMNDNLAGHYIVITTGRGSPANIPENARVLPYSVIESSILQRYPEKMILVDTLMNLLPTLRRSK